MEKITSVKKSESNEKIKDKINLNKNPSHLATNCLTTEANESQYSDKITTIPSAEISDEKNCGNLAKKTNAVEKLSEVSSSDDESEFQMTRLADDMKSSENESDLNDELSKKLIKKEWCICSNSQNKENLKLCDDCGQWFHILCAADEATITKVKSGHKVSLIDDFKCLLCRNDKEAMKKYDMKIIEERIKLRNERMISDSEEDKINRKIFISVNLDDDQTRKTLNEKKQLVKQRTQEQKKTKLLSDTKDKYRLKKIVQKVLTPKHKVGFIQEAKIQNSTHDRLDHSNRPKSSNETLKTNNSNTPNESKIKYISMPNTTSQKTANKIIPDREKTKSMLVKSFKERVGHVDEIKVSEYQIDLLCDKIEKEIYQQYGNSHEYMDRIKVIRLNVNEKSNKTFYRKILNGLIRPDQLPLMDKNDMKDDDLRRQDEENLRQDLMGRIEQSDELNEEIRKKQEALRMRKGIDDDLSALGSFTPLHTDLNNNDQQAQSPVQSLDDKISKCSAEPDVSEVARPIVIENLISTEKKRKHDSDFESDTELQPIHSKQTRLEEPLLHITLANISLPNKPFSKISSDIVWSGSLKLDSVDIGFTLQVNMKNINDFGPTSNRLKVLDSFKQRLSLNAINEFKIVKTEYLDVWTRLNPNSYLVFKFEPNLNLKSLFQPQYMTNYKEYESNEVLIALYEKMSSLKPSSFSYLLELPPQLQSFIEKIILFPVRRSPNEPEKEFDSKMKKYYGILLNRSTDSVLAFLLPKISSADLAKKNSPEQPKTSEQKNEAKDPRMRKTMRTSPPKLPEKNANINTGSEFAKNSAHFKSKETCLNENGHGNGHKVISLDVYKQKHKINTDLVESVPMDIDSPDITNHQPIFTSSSENFILINTILAKIGPDTSQQARSDILENMSNLTILKLLTQQEINELRQKYESSLPEFVQVLIKSSKKRNEMKENQHENEKKEHSNVLLCSEKKKESMNEKMVLPPKQLWQGPSKESFENLLKLHQASKERQSNGLAFDLTFENSNWNLDENNFKALDENLLNVTKEKNASCIDSEAYISSDGISSSNESCGFVKKTKCTARKSVSGLRNFVPKFKVKNN